LSSIEYLQALLNDTSEFSLIDAKKHLTNEAELCIMDLLSSKVGIQHVGPVIAAVSKMYGKVCANLPSEKTIRNVNDRMLALSVFIYLRNLFKRRIEHYTQTRALFVIGKAY
jgi:hypothetical protein